MSCFLIKVELCGIILLSVPLWAMAKGSSYLFYLIYTSSLTKYSFWMISHKKLR